MKFGGLALFGLLCSAFLLQASSACPSGDSACIEVANGTNAVTNTTFALGDGDLSPYTGTVGFSTSSSTSAITLYCDDYNNTFPTGSEQAVNITTLNSGNLSETKFGSANPNTNFPAGTTLYEEEAWLFTQLVPLLGTGSGNTNIATYVQEAAWELTATNLGSSVTTNQYVEDYVADAALNAATGGTGTAGTGGVSSGGSVDGVALVKASTNYAGWYILTEPGNNNDSTSGNQEFLAYSATGMTNQTTTPEPATFWLLAGALALGGIFRKSRTALRRDV